MSDRRSFLGAVATTGLASVAALGAIPEPPAAPATVEGTSDGETEWASGIEWGEEPITDEDASPVARFQYRATGDGFEPTSPINVVCPLAERPEGLPAVVAVLETTGWTTELEEYTRYAWDRQTGAYVLQQATAAETFFGVNGRTHARCWSFEGVVSMQVHEDSPARPSHAVAYARARRTVESLFRAAGWRVRSAALALDNETPPDHDGYASVVVPGERREEGANA